MEIQGTVYKVLEIQSGTSKAGNQWCRQMFVIEYGEQRPQKLAISLMNAKVQEFSHLLQPGARVSVKCEVTSREYENKWFTECMAWKVEAVAPVGYQQPQQTYQQPRHQPPFGQPFYPQQTAAYQGSPFGQQYPQNDAPPF